MPQIQTNVNNFPGRKKTSCSFVLAAKPPERTKKMSISTLPEAKKGGRGRHRVSP
jgi:hypothetical protein